MAATPDTSVTNNADGHASCQACQATGEASCQVSIAIKEVVRLVRGLVDCTHTTPLRQCRQAWSMQIDSRM